jgi:hypothetical protein
VTEPEIRADERRRLLALIQARVERHQQRGDVLRCAELRALLDQIRRSARSA